MLIATGSNLFLLRGLRIPSLLHHLLRPMKSPSMITTKLHSTISLSPWYTCALLRNRNASKKTYLWISAFEGGSSVGLRPFNPVSMRFTGLIVILELAGEAGLPYGMILGFGHCEK
jgi:hypothetical protein